MSCAKASMDLRSFICLSLLLNLRLSTGQILGCPEGQWQCDDGHCVQDTWRCDGEGDCLDGSDEMDCDASQSSGCPAGQFACLDSVGCVDTSARCDGKFQCPTGSDEENCPTVEGCLDSEWMCLNGICVSKEVRCNKHDDCGDNSDEENCAMCDAGGVRCPDGTCLLPAAKCDGEFHCSDGSDEPQTCGRICSRNNGGCSHVCTDEYWGTLCSCPVGYKLAPNDVVCEDVDECASPFPPCSQHCTNTIGSYYCDCKEDFKLEEKSKCQTSGNSTQLLMVQKNEMALLNVKSQQFHVVTTSVFDPVAFTFDITRGWFSWADKRGNIHKSNEHHSWIIFSGEPGIKGLACDWLNGILFWTNQKTESIYMQSADGTEYTTLLNKNVRPSELVLLPVESLMFWMNEGPGDRVTLEKSWMDGSDRSTLTVITSQLARGLTVDVAAKRLYWISNAKKSVETVRVDGTGRHSFTGIFNKRPALSLAAFESMFYWVDGKGLWQVPQNQPGRKKFLWKMDLPLLNVYHQLQQPKGPSVCANMPCRLCQLTKSSAVGFTCACPYFKVLLPDGTCEYPRFLYATITKIYLLEFRGRESTEMQIFTTEEGILSFDLDWYRDWLYWANRTGHLQRTSTTQDKVELIPTPLPVCLINVDQRTSNLYWVSCDQKIIGTTVTGRKYPQQLYRTTKEIRNFYLDWLRGGMFWLEEERIFSMNMMEGKAKELLQMTGVSGNVAFDLRASSLLWNSRRAGLTTLSLLKERSHQAGRRWNISGSVVAAFEPFLLSISDDVMTLWDRRDGSNIQSVTVKGRVLGVVTVLGDVQIEPDAPDCNAPSMLCQKSSTCIPQVQVCDGKRDCPEGDDEEFCVATCSSKEFKCKDSRSCIPTSLVCDGRSHCHDGSDEVGCPTEAAPVTRANVLKCRSGSMLCEDGTECVLYSHVCDGEKDCKDGSDEAGCDGLKEITRSANKSLVKAQAACHSPSVLCPSAPICISPSQFCNEIKDCPDGFDEKSCLKSCPSKTDFHCKDRRNCVPKSLVCDGVSHCHDGSDEVDCPNAPQTKVKCRFGSRLCRDGAQCVLSSHVCDGERDCRDGSDEEGCGINLSESEPAATTTTTTPPCTSPSFLCPDSSICIEQTQMCDGRKDCPDGSDEKCMKKCPSQNDFRCKDRLRCIPKSQVCDGRSHCNDGSDEVNCQSATPLPESSAKVLKCRFGSKLCRDGTACVPLSHLCDGERDCQDGSDEQGCDVRERRTSSVVENNKSPVPTEEMTPPPTTPPCTSPSVLCPASSICIKSTQMCDGRRDCPDGFDEKCIRRCPSRSDFRCKDRRSCVPRNKVCDGRSHCIDGSDELNCRSAALPETSTQVLKCRFGSRMCRDGTSCVLLTHVCDGERDCQDGSDEEGCDESENAPGNSDKDMTETPAPTEESTPPPTTPPCTSPSILCPASSICIKPTQMCDGRRDCPDGFDEKCVKRCPTRTDFRCKDLRSCVPRSKVCDGRAHCNDGSDEVDCQSATPPPESPTKVTKCRFGSKLCRDGTSCVLFNSVCDGEKDCPDGSDEEGCDDAGETTGTSEQNEDMSESPAPIEESTPPPTTPPCTSPSVLCPASSICIKPTQMCDGRRDCPDGFDEKCVKRCPSRTDFRCKDRRSCVPRNQVCDGRSHCIDGSDELNCRSAALPETSTQVLKCRFGSRMCRDGTSCVLLTHVCDGERDCQDGSDEEGCDKSENVPGDSDKDMTETPAPTEESTPPPTTPPCTSPSVLCPASSTCIKPTQMCDGRRDCPDGFDEKCVKRCPTRTDFRCKDLRSCVPRSRVCDGRAHCNDGSDEVDCQSATPPPESPTKVTKCRFGSKLCRDGTSCVLFNSVCDGEKDCPDGSDEEGCDDAGETTGTSEQNEDMSESPAPIEESTPPPTTPPCTSPSVLCPASSICIKPTQMCDGRRDCPDGFDEKCVKRCPSRTDFRCKDRRSCVPRNQVCDGRSHCIDGSDELNCRSAALPETSTQVLKCRFGSRMCQDGTSCVLLTHVCDGERDCQDGSDEEGCDDAENAPGNSDGDMTDSPAPIEISTPPPTTPPCTSPSVLCPASSICIKPTQMCDGRRDCPDGFDEKCVKRCPSQTDFRCKDRLRCVPRSQVCDGRSHCNDGSDELNCARAEASPESPNKLLKCRFGTRMCQDGTGCVLLSHVCDGEKDCPDGSDENECDVAAANPVEKDVLNESPESFKQFTPPPTTSLCTSPSVLCPASSICIKPAQMCDGRRDCPDGFDEKCVRRCPSRTDFRCKDRRGCVPRSQVCDGRSHCIDGSDELNCARAEAPPPPESPNKLLKCRFGSRLCRDGMSCVLSSHVCDGERDCLDGSDEDGCDDAESDPVISEEGDYRNEFPAPTEEVTPPPTTPPCTSPSVLCPASSICIKPTQMCDGRRDCPDGFDEKCVKRCPSRTDFRCKDRRSCVPRSQVCDGRSHCIDGSDELNCPGVALPKAPAPANVLKCRMGSTLCRDGTECVLSTHVCDGERDCRDGSDEEECEMPIDSPPLGQPSCSFPAVQCPGSFVCINPSQLCDGIQNCPDGSDENCVKKCADRTDFLCKDRRSCVSRSLVCDGRAHCYDGSDEANCRGVSALSAPANVLKCRMGSRLCNDGKECVLFSHVCDGEIDCLDGSDEQGCQETCKTGEFQCAHGKMCIPETEVCDGKPQCRDRSDERDCWKQTKSCEHRCADAKRCIPKKFICDGEQDCLDGSDEVDCDFSLATTVFPLITSPPTCFTPSVLCPASTKCVSQNQLCDGKKDCPDGFDEKDCVVRCENPNDFLCSDQRKCIPRNQVCDGRSHCPDGSDEIQCHSGTSVTTPSPRSGPVKCRTGFKPCRNGLECVMYSHVCDGEKDCEDGSDEEGCESRCKSGEFQCSHGKKCIPQEQVCDGRNDCQDGSDEKSCPVPSEGCDHRCDNNTRCVPQTFLCDGERDCADGSDEGNCGSVACASNQYRCSSGQCVSEAFKCDGYPDCKDHSDEMNCPRPPRCPVELRCPNSHECLQKEWLCDGEEDCKDGSDEKNCTSAPAKCRKYQLQCGDSGQCVPLSWRCDGKKDCSNGFDEDNCSLRVCPFHLYQCGTKECLETKLVCNGFTNCADGSDEGVGCAQHNCSGPSAPSCDHSCVSTPNGARCFCGAGYKLQSSSKSCVDVDECNSTPGASCKHICQNTRGSYSCQCHPGFYLEPDGKSCKPKGSGEPLLLASVQSELLVLGIHSNNLQLLSLTNRPVFSLDYDVAQQRVYWLSPEYQSIRWADMKTSNKGTLIKGVQSDSIAVDWVGKNLYWVDGLVGQILAVKLSSTITRSQDFAVVLGENLEQPSSLILLPNKGLMLWSEVGSVPQIERAGMDGSQRKVVVSRDLIWPVGLAYDFMDDRVYWADEKLHCIGSASLNGDNIKILQLAETPSPFSVAVFNDRVFWSDTKRRTVRSAEKKTGKNQKVLLKKPGQPFGLKLMHTLSQPVVANPCEQMNCSHLCLLAPGNTAVCRCPKGLLLSQGIACSLPKESSFILFLSRDTVNQVYLRSMSRDGIALKKMPNGRAFALPGIKKAVGLDFSISELLLYVANSKPGAVDVLRLSKSRSSPKLELAGQIVKLQEEDLVTALAVDWVTSNLYWCSKQRPDIHVTAHSDGYTISLLQGSLGVGSITLHPSSGRLCYTAVVVRGATSQAEVDCAWMDGRNKVVLWRKASMPISLVFSTDGTRIYWADSGEGVISSIGVDGSEYKEYKTGPNLLVSFTRIEKVFFWITLEKDVSKLWFSDGLQPKQLWFQTKAGVVEMRSYNDDSQSGSNSCSERNGGCAHLCLPHPGGRTCKCGRGFYNTNSTFCNPLPSCPAGEESCFDGSECVSSSKFCDGRVDCSDGSDELDCSNVDSASRTRVSDQSSSLHPDLHDSVLSDKDSASCDLKRCNNHGRCVSEGKATRCLCLPGYKGQFCEEQSRTSHPAVIIVAFCLVAAVIVAVFVFSKRKGWKYFSRSPDKETLMDHMALPEQDSDSEELESPADVKKPLQTLKPVQLE